MAKSKKRRKVLVFSIIAVVLLGLTALVIFKKRDIVITVQTEKVSAAQPDRDRPGQRPNPARPAGQDQRRGQRRNHRAAGQGRADGREGRLAGEDQAGLLHRRHQPGQRQLQVRAGGQDHGARPTCARPRRSSNATRTCSGRSWCPIPRSTKCRRPMMWPRRSSKAPRTRWRSPKPRWTAPGIRSTRPPSWRRSPAPSASSTPGWASACWAPSRTWAPKS